ncbi:unnamed protein product [Allacma fusca]|uniref:Uncharacterized protein n=1 Tax=Allacma fusca TaxID=39272 RepID=A0A8J2KET8_9HEXA|nr:unnamed protein product [Allacma fusca]
MSSVLRRRKFLNKATRLQQVALGGEHSFDVGAVGDCFKAVQAGNCSLDVKDTSYFSDAIDDLSQAKVAATDSSRSKKATTAESSFVLSNTSRKDRKVKVRTKTHSLKQNDRSKLTDVKKQSVMPRILDTSE